MALDIATGMVYNHSQDIVHKDLKPDNILITEDFHMKVAEFGLACEEAQCNRLANGAVAGTVPFEDITPAEVAFAVLKKNMRPPVPEHCHPTMRALIEQCWSSKPKKRPEFWQIVQISEQFEA
ncbi:hypothetical protein ACH5RR_001592 [Cinchona calisaya]|uniref:Protein kinase domain-containing protein n=1 Tax=Cinchona calisaya TaxID=153742 RepID=A0ABD3B493_9GENT